MTTTTTYTNLCVRCGKQRIDGKTWKEKVESHFGSSYIVHTETVCPDKECQKIVNEKMAAEKKRAEDLKLEKEEKLKNLHKKGKVNKS